MKRENLHEIYVHKQQEKSIVLSMKKKIKKNFKRKYKYQIINTK